MQYRDKPHFVVKKNKQKVGFISDEITPDVLKDICKRITGQSEFTVDYVDNAYSDDFLDKGYNKGRMAIMQYEDSVSYITFSEKNIDGRNSSLQSVPTAFNMYYMNNHPKKHIYYYFLDFKGNGGTPYHLFIYRLMKTIGFEFLNAKRALNQDILGFSSIEDIMYFRKANTGKNKSNNSTYITKSDITRFDVYGKTYGANKYETSLICYAISHLASSSHLLTLYEMNEGNLSELPKSSLAVLNKMGNFEIVSTDMQLEKHEFEKSNSLRSPQYIYNMLKRLGNKCCALCGCEIPEIVQGAHILPVSEIKRMPAITLEQKIKYATDGNNGLWLCENHHKLFDEGIIGIKTDGNVFYREEMADKYIIFMDEITTIHTLPSEIMSKDFVHYLDMRNKIVV